jgi:hypothetical protein
MSCSSKTQTFVFTALWALSATLFELTGFSLCYATCTMVMLFSVTAYSCRADFAGPDRHFRMAKLDDRPRWQ